MEFALLLGGLCVARRMEVSGVFTQGKLAALADFIGLEYNGSPS